MSVLDVLPAQRDWEGRGWMPPGPQLAILLPADDRLGDLSDAELVEVTAAARRQTSWAQARQLAAIAELARRRHTEDDLPDAGYRVLTGHESLLEEVSAALTVTGNAAATLVHLADRLTTVLPATRAALETGRLDLPRARVIADAVDGLNADVCAQVEDAVIDRASEQTTGQLRRRLKRVVRRLAPHDAEEQAEQVKQDRRLEMWPGTVGGIGGLALLNISADDATAIHHKITAVGHALKADGDDRPLDQIRADLATELLRGHDLPDAVRALLAGAPGEPCAAPELPEPVVGRVLDAGQADLAGSLARRCADAVSAGGSQASALDLPGAGDLDEQQVATADAQIGQTVADAIELRLCQVDAHVQVTGGHLPTRIAQSMRQVQQRLGALRETWCRATGGHGHDGYRPPAAMRRLIEARHATCAFPTCNRRSDRCDLDHTVSYGQDGATCRCNLAPLCRRHHRTKQSQGWELFQPWPGLLVWITPAGTWHIALPDRQ